VAYCLFGSAKADKLVPLLAFVYFAYSFLKIEMKAKQRPPAKDQIPAMSKPIRPKDSPTLSRISPPIRKP